MNKVKVLGEKYGIQITRHWNEQMYEHNNSVSLVMIANISDIAASAYKSSNEVALRDIHRIVAGHGMGSGYSMEEILNAILSELMVIQNYWLRDQYPALVKAGYVADVEKNFVGYDKI